MTRLSLPEILKEGKLLGSCSVNYMRNQCVPTFLAKHRVLRTLCSFRSGFDAHITGTTFSGIPGNNLQTGLKDLFVDRIYCLTVMSFLATQDSPVRSKILPCWMRAFMHLSCQEETCTLLHQKLWLHNVLNSNWRHLRENYHLMHFHPTYWATVSDVVLKFFPLAWSQLLQMFGWKSSLTAGGS